MKTVAQLKRDANSGRMEVKCVIRCGQPVMETHNGDRFANWRKVDKANTVDLIIEGSHLSIPKASLLEYTEDRIKIYSPGYRDYNETEKKAVEEWNKIASTEEYKKQVEYDVLTDGTTSYYKEKYFFEDKKLGYLLGFEYQRGCKLDWNKRASGEPCIIDERIKGNLYMEYEVRFSDESVTTEIKEEIKPLQYSCWGTTYNVLLRVDRYYKGKQLYIGLFDPNEGPVADVTVSLYGQMFSPLKENEQYVDTNNSPDMGGWLERNKIAKFTGLYGFSGYCAYPLYRFDMDMLKKYAM